jgi:Fe-S-cluster containining protein
MMHPIIRLLFKCKKCGKCCNLSRSISEADIEEIMEHTHEQYEDVEAKLNSYPCGYYDGNCQVHLFKPRVCAWYPGYDAECPGYQEIAQKINVPGAMTRVCNDPELSALMIKVMLTQDKDAAFEILKRLNIKW